MKTTTYNKRSRKSISMRMFITSDITLSYVFGNRHRQKRSCYSYTSKTQCRFQFELFSRGYYKNVKSAVTKEEIDYFFNN